MLSSMLWPGLDGSESLRFRGLWRGGTDASSATTLEHVRGNQNVHILSSVWLSVIITVTSAIVEEPLMMIEGGRAVNVGPHNGYGHYTHVQYRISVRARLCKTRIISDLVVSPCMLAWPPMRGYNRMWKIPKFLVFWRRHSTCQGPCTVAVLVKTYRMKLNGHEAKSQLMRAT